MLNGATTLSDSRRIVCLSVCLCYVGSGPAAGVCCHHVPDEHFYSGRGGSVESGNLPPETQVCPAKTNHILPGVTRSHYCDILDK